MELSAMADVRYGKMIQQENGSEATDVNAD